MTLLTRSDRTQETANDIGLSVPIVLLGAAAPGLQSFQMAGLDGEIVPYTIEHETSGQWEVGSGEYVAATHTLNRTTIYASSSGGLINFANGVVDVWVDMPAEKSVMLDADSTHLTLPAGLSMGGALDGVTTLDATGAVTLHSTLTVTTNITPSVDNAAPLGTSSKRWSDVRSVLATFSGLVTTAGGLTVSSGQTLALAGATVSGAPTWSSNQAITLSTANQPNVTTMTALVTVGALSAGSIAAGFGAINNAGNGLTTGALSATTGLFAGNVTPSVDNTYALGGASFRWSDLRAMTATFSSAVTLSATLTIGGITYTWPGAQPAGGFLQNNGSGTLSWVTEGAGISLAGLDDVSLSSNTNGQVLTYNSATSKWNNNFVTLLTGVGTITAGVWAAGAVSPGVDNTSALGTASFRWADLRAVTATFSGLATFNLGATVASGQTLTLTGATVAGAPTWSSNQAITLSTAAQPNITSLGTLTGLTMGGAIGAQAITPNTDNTYALGTASFRWSDLRSVLATFSGVVTLAATAAFTAASPFSVANGQILTVSTTAQTVGAATLTLPNFANVSDTFAFLTLAQTLANKTLSSPTISGTVAGTPTIASSWTWSSNQPITLSTAAQPNVTSLGTLAANLLFVDATYDIGASGATRARNLFLSGNITAGGTLTTGLINGQTISSAANFTGTMAVASTINAQTISSAANFTGTMAIAGVTAIGAAAGSGGASQTLQVHSTIGPLWAMRSSNNASGANFSIVKSRGTTAGSIAAVQAGDVISILNFLGVAGDGATIPSAAQIVVTVPTSGVATTTVAAGFTFITTNIAGSAAVRLGLSSEGVLTPGADNTYALGTGSFRWSDLQTVTGTFGGALTAQSTATITGVTSIGGAAGLYGASTQILQLNTLSASSIRAARAGADGSGVTFATLKSRGASVGALAKVIAGDLLFNLNMTGIADDNSTISTGATYQTIVPTGGVPAGQNWIAADHVWGTTNIGGTTASRMWLSSEGVLAVGGGYAQYGATSQTLQVNSLGTASFRTSRSSADTAGVSFVSIKSRGATIGSSVALIAGDQLALYSMSGIAGDGATIATGTQIVAQIPTSGVASTTLAGQLMFNTTNIAGTLATRLMLTSEGVLEPFADNSYALGTASLRWSDFQSMTGTFGGLITASAGITVQSAQAVQFNQASNTANLYNSLAYSSGHLFLSPGSSATGGFVPNVDNQQPLGLSSNRWSDVRAMTATIYGSITMGGASGSPSLTINGGATGTPQVQFSQNGTIRGYAFYANASSLLCFNQSGGGNAGLTVDSGDRIIVGNGTQMSTKPSMLIFGSNTQLQIDAAAATNGEIYFSLTGTSQVRIGMVGATNSFRIRDDVNAVDRLVISTTGVTTFSANVLTTTGFVYGFTGAAEYMSGDTSAHTLTFATNTSIRMTLNAGLQMGTPTGGDKGGGTINVQTDIFKQGSAYTNPDYVFEMLFTGEIVKHSAKSGAEDFKLRTLDQVEAICRDTFKLPAFQKEGLGLFSGGDALLESVESAYGYLFDHEKRLARLEKLAA